MLRTLISFLLFVPLFVFGQNKSNDSLQHLYNKAQYWLIENRSPDIAIKYLNQILEADSSYYKIYNKRAICYLYKAEYELRDSNNKLIHTENDTHIIANAINDIEKCIELYRMDKNTFPENYIFPLDSFEVSRHRRLGTKKLLYENVLTGLNFYLSKNNGNIDSACFYWNKEKELYKMDGLIKRYCCDNK